VGRSFLARERYLPAAWAADAARRAEAGVPASVAFRTKPQLAQAMRERAVDAGVPAAWVSADEVDGGDRRRRVWREARGVGHVLAIKRTEPLSATTSRGPAQVHAAALVAALSAEAWHRLSAEAWHRLSAGDGATGPRRYDWARVPIRPLGEPGKGYCKGYWLLARRRLADSPEVAHFVCSGPAATRVAELVRVAGSRWAIEAGLEAAKGEVGLDHYEVRRWDGWYRHVTLCLLAHADLAVTRARAAGTDKGGGR